MEATVELSRQRLDAAYQTALAALLAERHSKGYWVGELSSSALSTATAIMALTLMDRQRHADLIVGGLKWLVEHQNPDGGWGDTSKSLSNISTTMLCRVALYHCRPQSADCEWGLGIGNPQFAIRNCEAWLFERYGRTPAELAEAVRQRYGKDRTFSVPILTTCALAGLVEWKEVPPLPFELACFPQGWYRFLKLQVVSYALPALIAIGQCIYHHRPPWNPLTRWIRWLAKGPALRVLKSIQPSNGGFLEATPLTSFVTMSLAACGLASHPVARKGADFLVQSVRPDGSWPIDTNLSIWVTTLAINALAAAGEERHYPFGGWGQDFLFDGQFGDRHPYTGADPGGWGWTDRPGSVPDADDTAGALLALSHYLSPYEHWPASVVQGLGWLLRLQNNDGGWPTFCRGWGALPFDRSGSDLTAHALRALGAWVRGWSPQCRQVSCLVASRGKIAPAVHFSREEVLRALQNGFAYLARMQRPDGSWLPLWFGNQHAPDDINPTYGTARVLAAYRDLDRMNEEPAQRGLAWLLAHQNDDGGWGGGKGVPSSTEETALAVEVLLDFASASAGADATGVALAVNRGLLWLVERVEAGTWKAPSPIGFYFAKLWYFEKLYPLIWTVAALGRARRRFSQSTTPTPP